MSDIPLRYGLNPHQVSAILRAPAGRSPLRVLNGHPSYINALDALTAWQLVRELAKLTGKVAAASYKHVSPAGAAVSGAISAERGKSQFLPALPSSQVARAYVRARGADRMSSFGDAAAVSSAVDGELAEILSAEVSDLIIAPAYEASTLNSLRAKKGGKYLILEIDPAYEPEGMEARDVFGFTLVQDRNIRVTDGETFRQADTGNLREAILETLIVGTTALKYTQSNSVCLSWEGQVIGMAAGQQSRIHCTRLACEKAEKWMLQTHPKVLSLRFPAGMGKPERTNAIDQYILWDRLSPDERRSLTGSLGYSPEPLTPEEVEGWLRRFEGICMSSDGFIPFRDNIDRAAATGVQYIAHPGGALRDESIREAAHEHNIVIFETGLRCFHH